MTQLLLRLVVAYGMGVFFLAESFNRGLLRANIPSRALFIHVCFAFLGVACFVQAVVLHRQFRNQRLR
jgi:hypothetical protein